MEMSEGYKFEMNMGEWHDTDEDCYRGNSKITWEGDADSLPAIVADFKDWLRATGHASSNIDRITYTPHNNGEAYGNPGGTDDE